MKRKSSLCEYELEYPILKGWYISNLLPHNTRFELCKDYNKYSSSHPSWYRKWNKSTHSFLLVQKYLGIIQLIIFYILNDMISYNLVEYWCIANKTYNTKIYATCKYCCRNLKTTQLMINYTTGWNNYMVCKQRMWVIKQS